MDSNVIEVNLIDLNNFAAIDNEEVVDYVVEEDEDEEAEELPMTMESCLLLNNVYIESIDEMKQFLISKKRENDSRQLELNKTANLKIVRDVTINNNFGYTHPNSLIPFMAPYFKDIKGLTAPYNADTIEKKRKGEINQSYVCTNKPWNVIERQRIRDILQFDATQRLHKPLRDEKEKLTKDKTNIKTNMQRIAELTTQIDDLNSVDPYQLPVPDRWEDSLDWLKFATELDTDHNADDCELYWNNYLHPNINKSEWNKSEDERLEELVTLHGLHDWDRVAEELGTNRLGWQCCSRYQSELNSDVKRIGPLTKAEAKLVEKVIQQCRVGDFIPWHQVKYFIEGRTLPQIKHYWNKINVLKRGDNWSEDENRQLLLAVKKCGTHNWRKVAQYLPGRSNRQCRERYMMRLNFGNGRKLGDWTAAEDKLILELAPKHNFKWVQMEQQIKGRNARQIASRYDLLIRYKSKEKDKNKKKGKFDNKTGLATRTLAVKNRVYERIRNLINREKNQNLDQQLRIGKQKLAQRLELEMQGIPIPSNRGRPKKTNAEENLDQKIIDMFATFDVKTSPKRIISRSAQDQCVYETTKNVFNELLCGKPFESETDLTKAIRLLINKSITSKNNTETIDMDPIPGPSTSSTPDNWTPPPPVLPPNRITVRGLRGLLMHTDYFSQTIAKSEIPLDELSNAIKDDSNYAKLFSQFKSLFYWPALISMVEPPEKDPPQQESNTSSKTGKSKRNSWLKTDSARMIEIRRNQSNIIHTEMERNAKNKIEIPVNEETLHEGSAGVPWYVTNKERKYYNLKSLDKKSFVFTRIKPKHGVIPQKENRSKRKVAESQKSSTEEEEETEVESNDSDSEKKIPIKKRKYQRKKSSHSNADEIPVETIPRKKKKTRVQTRRSARLSMK